MHQILLGEAHFAIEIIHSEMRLLLRPFSATNNSFSLCLPHVHMKVITHANNWSLTLPFFTRAPED